MAVNPRLSTAARSLAARFQNLQANRDILLARAGNLVNDPSVADLFGSFATDFGNCDRATENFSSIPDEDCPDYHRILGAIERTEASLMNTLRALQDRLGESPVYNSLLELEGEFMAERNMLRQRLMPVSGEAQDLVNKFDQGLDLFSSELRRSMQELDTCEEVPERWQDAVRQLQLLWTDVQNCLKFDVLKSKPTTVAASMLS
jgi:hypothetical protein